MAGDTFIDTVIRDHELQDPTDGDNAGLRLQILGNLQSIVNQVEMDWPWPHKVTPTSPTLTLTTSGDVDLPANFQDFGHNGTMWIVVGGGQPDIPVWLRPLHEVIYLRRRWPAGVQNPRLCAVNGFNTTTKRKILSFAPVPTGNLTIYGTYDRKPVTIVDQTDPGSGMDLIPEDLHRPLLYEGVVMRQMRDKGDIRADTSQLQAFNRHLKEAKEANNPMRGQVLRMPPYPGAAGFAFR